MRGRLIAERYRLEDRVGAGGMGVVWRAFDVELDRVVALKRSQVGDSTQIRREARIGAGLQHPNVVTVFDAVIDDGERWLIMEYLPSRALSDVEKVSPAQAARIGAQIASALAAMHAKGMAHRDVKPGNVLLAADGTAKLSDLGIARWDEVTRTGEGEAVGTPGFLAPEVAEGHESSAASDVFALGATLFASVEGVSPWGPADDGPAPQRRRAAAFELEPARHAGELGPVLAEMMRREPAARPTAQRAAALLAGVTGDAPPRRPRRRVPRKLVRTVAVVAVLLLVADVLVPKLFADHDTTGDPVTMDPCALLDPTTLSRFTSRPIRVDATLMPFNQCALFLPMSDEEGDVVQVSLKVQQPNLYGIRSTTPPGLGPVKRHGVVKGECANDIPMPDRNWVQIVAKHRQGKPADLCGVVDALTTGTLLVLSAGQIPRLATPRPPQSLVHVDACTLLEGEDMVRALDTEVPPYPELGGWGCSWEASPKEVVIEFNRKEPLDPTDGRPTTIGGRPAYIDPDVPAWPEACLVKIEHRRFQDDPVRIERVDVFYDRSDVEDTEQLCDTAVALAEAVVSRLPQP
ncbi:protein kinase [Actinosynnema sp. NPDC023658]|uniref:serine/threonine-protein kinase n=1 Tax=Actinosynnema sp. NPDC023658 TaxID=3155465 RepID=UPI0033E3F27A